MTTFVLTDSAVANIEAAAEVGVAPLKSTLDKGNKNEEPFPLLSALVLSLASDSAMADSLFQKAHGIEKDDPVLDVNDGNMIDLTKEFISIRTCQAA